MTLVAKQTGSAFAKTPEGTYPARCVQVYDIGTQTNDEFESVKRQVVLGFELDHQNPGDDTNALVWGWYTHSLHEKAKLRAHLEAWRGKKFSAEELEGFDLSKLLGVPCLISVSHNTKGNPKVAAVMAPPKGASTFEATHPLRTFDVDNPDMAVFDTFNDHMKQIVMASPEWDAATSGSTTAPKQQAHQPIPEDEIPF